MIINALQKGIKPNTDVSKQVNELFCELADNDEETELNIAPGEYYLTAENCPEKMLYITNTVGDDEFDENETPHLARIGLFLFGIKNLTINGEGAVFVIDGRVTNCAIVNCENIKINGIEFRHINPEEHEFTVTKVTPFTVEFKLDNESRYVKNGSCYNFIGRDYSISFYKSRVSSWGWFGKVSANNKEHIERVCHPFKGAISVNEISKGVFRAKYLNTSRFCTGERYCVFETRRQNAGIFADTSKNISLFGVKQSFNYSLALVAQNCENITVDSVRFAPDEKQDKLLCSLADFMQFCMCRGQIKVVNSYFCGAGDDCLNVHGIHFKIVKVQNNALTLRYMHSQTHGFNPLRVGDTISFVNPNTLLHGESTKIIETELINENDILIKVESANGAQEGMVTEDISACPDLYFANNYLSRIITRGLLITTSGKVIVENNNFNNTEMAAILFSDDAKNWYESGNCTDVTVKNNRFGECGAYYIQILPENGNTKSIVHGSFIIKNNSFESSINGGIDANCAKSISLFNNTGLNKDTVKTNNIDEYVFE